MPIRADLLHFYGREWREVVRPRILARAGDRCEQCRVPNREIVLRTAGWWRLNIVWLWADPLTWWHRENGKPTVTSPDPDRALQITLTIAHLNHVAGDDRDENLKALCQWCHLHLDAFHHHLTRAARKDAARPLFQQETDRRIHEGHT